MTYRTGPRRHHRHPLASVEPVERRQLLSAATHAVFAAQATAATAGTGVALAVALEDAAGHVDTAQSGPVTLSISTGPANAAITGTVTATAANGVATFSSDVLKLAGTYTLHATYGSLTPATSAAVTVTPAAAAKLVVAGPTGSVPAVVAGGSPGTVTVDVVDGYGNVESADETSQVSVIPGDPDAVVEDDTTYLGGTTTKTVTDGVATFDNLTLLHAGKMYLSFSDGDLRSANLNNLTVTPGPAVTLAFLADPATTPAGQVVDDADGNPIQVAVEDAYGNVAVDATTVTLATPSGPQSAAAVAGVATFADVAVSAAGQYALTATAPGLTAATSAAFDVTVATGTPRTVLLNQPATVTAGQASGDVVVQLQDSYGNVDDAIDGTTVPAVLTRADGVTLAVPATVANGELVLLHGQVLTVAGTYTVGIDATTAAAVGVQPFTSQPFAVVAGPATELTVAPATLDATAGLPLGTLTVSAADAYGNAVTAAVTTVTLGGAPFTAGATNAATAAGTATFTGLAIATPGTYTLTASAPGLTSDTDTVRVRPSLVPLTAAVAGRSAGAVSVDLASYFPTASTARSVSVTVANAAGARVAAMTVRAARGVAVGRLPAIRTAGTYTVTVTTPDGQSAQQTMTVAAAAPARLAFAAAPVVADGTVSATVRVVDQFGNAVAAGTTVTLSAVAVRGPRPTLVGIVTATADATGTAAFAGLTVSPAGRVKLLAKAARLSPARSAVVDVD